MPGLHTMQMSSARDPVLAMCMLPALPPPDKRDASGSACARLRSPARRPAALSRYAAAVPSALQAFVIKKIRYLYEYQGGRYKMVGKGAAVKAASREAHEAFLERLLPDQAAAIDDPVQDWPSISEIRNSGRRDDGDDEAAP